LVGAYSAVYANTSIGDGRSSQTPDRTRPVFGVDLAEAAEQMRQCRTSGDRKSCVAIEKYGLRSQGIYRMVRKVASLKERLYNGPHLETLRSLEFHVVPADMGSVNLDSEDWISDY